MSELQLSLILIGAVVIAGIFLFNRFQERKFRREAEKAFGELQHDVLLDQPAVTRSARKIEDSAEAKAPEALAKQQIEPTLGLDPEPPPASPLSEAIDYVVSLRGVQPVSGRAVKAAIDRKPYRGKAVLWQGRAASSGAWHELRGTGFSYSELRAALQLADRGGPVTEQDIANFSDAAKRVAAELKLTAHPPDADMAARRATQLDLFGSEVDIVIGISIISADGGGLPATNIALLAEAAGMKLAADGVFHMRDERGESQFSLTNQEARKFTADLLPNTTTQGITFLLDVPRAAAGVDAFDRMAALARRFADTLPGIVVDDNRTPLTDIELKRIRAQLEAVIARMASQGIPAGGEVALRLFSQ